jgi:hypothetical protein
VVRSPRLKLALLALAVIAGHLAGLEWISLQADQASGLTLMVPPMYTRMLQPAAPPPVVAVPAHAPARSGSVAALAPRPPASSPDELREQRAAEARARREAREQAEARALAEAHARALAEAEALAEALRKHDEQLAQQAAPPASAASAAPAASAPSAASPAASAPSAETAQAPASAASAAATDTAALDRWPVDTRLNYALTGQYRGPLYGDARVQWQREGDRYQVRLEARIDVFGTQVLTSQGKVTADGLQPHAYEETRPGKRRFARIGEHVVELENGKTLPKPPGVQDTASQFVELTQRFASGREPLVVGHAVTLWLARPGGVDEWVYEIVGRDLLTTPKFGTLETYHLKPRPITSPRGNINVEMWFAPSLQYLPVRIKLTMGQDTWLDLVIDHIEQR